MSRRIRFIPEEGVLVEVTCRALHSRLLFRPSLTLNEIIIGALALGPSGLRQRAGSMGVAPIATNPRVRCMMPLPRASALGRLGLQGTQSSLRNEASVIAS